MSQTYTNAFECQEVIGRWLAEAAPEPWTKITIDFEVVEIDDVSEYCIVYVPAGKTENEEHSLLTIRDSMIASSSWLVSRAPRKRVSTKSVVLF